MRPIQRLRKLPEAINYLHIDNVNSRSGFGDNRAATEDAMMALHAQSLCKAGLISPDMETQLSRGRHERYNLKTVYTNEYLAMHPRYTGSNVDEMPSYESALRRQKEKDVAKEKWLADYKAGKIDVNGNPTHMREGFASSIGSLERGSSIILDFEKSAHDNTITANGHPDEITRDTATCGKLRQAPTSCSNVHHVEHKTVQKAGIVAKTKSIEQPDIQDTLLYTPLRMPPTSTEPTTSTAPVLLSHLGQPLPQPQHKPKRRPRTITTVAHLSPRPGQLTYTHYGYYALAALCRERRLSSGGTAPVLRNRLIQDDTNAAQGIQRVTKRYNYASRKVYKHGGA